jgi:hypothetical protein
MPQDGLSGNIALAPIDPLFGEQTAHRVRKSLEEEELVGEISEPFIVIQRVQIPPDQSRADRSVASLAILRATGGCEAETTR